MIAREPHGPEEERAKGDERENRLDPEPRPEHLHGRYLAGSPSVRVIGCIFSLPVSLSRGTQDGEPSFKCR